MSPAAGRGAPRKGGRVYRTWMTWWARRARGAALGALTLLFVGYNLAMRGAFTPPRGRAPQAPDLRLTYTPAALDAMLASWQGAETAFIVGHLVVDGLYPLVYGSWLMLALARLYGPRVGARVRVGWWPLVAVLADWGENVALSVRMALYPRPMPLLAWLSAACTLTKWLAVALSVGAVLAGAAWAGWRAWRHGGLKV